MSDESQGSNEHFSVDPTTGKKVDAHIHTETDEHRRVHARTAVLRAVRDRGMTHEQAQRLYGFRSTSEVG